MPATKDVIIVGAGFAGLYMLYRARLLGLSATVIEAGSGVGGTWYWNRYPGARCDVESMSYSYSFSEDLQQDWVWPDRYAVQPDILHYANHVADRFGLRRDILLETRVLSARFDPVRRLWKIDTDRGDEAEARHLIMATGCLSVPNLPDIPGLDRFAGRVLHTAEWPQDGVDLTGHDVGLIGTGSSGVQSIPLIAAQARRLTVFQRTANFSIPAWNGPMPETRRAAMKRDYPALRARSRASGAGDYAEESVVSILDLSPSERDAAFEQRWRQGGFNFQYAFRDVMTDPRANELAAEFVRNKIRAMVADPDVAERLCPKDYPFGAKRLCVDTGYYENFNRDNVTLVDLRSDPITTITETGLRTAGAVHDFDTLVLATGFHAMTGALERIDIRGRDGVALKDRWRDGPATYLGLAVAGFPNLFLINGPGSPSVLANMVLACEQHVEWIAGLLAHARTRSADLIEADPAAQTAWT
ncbi:MAG: NAD(P)/FAD-dependent oxidoreductase, partial [Albidovulum sp.]|uniref:flavin-containing monooxygenase n=1 Tax=Albidovulum sp. TaxID=1872424 RepID=UPI003CB7B03F